MTQDKIAAPKFAIGAAVAFYGICPVSGKILDRRWNPRVYLGHDGIGSWQYLIEDCSRWYNERALVKHG